MNALALFIETSDSIDVMTIVISLLGGLALFLYGMDQMTEALKKVAGGRMKDMLAQLTTNRFKALLVGTFVTAIIQSSSVTTVLVVGFISAGLMTLSQSIGIILGADIGTTITAQIVAFKVTKYALLLIAIGFAMMFLSKRKTHRQYGMMLMGLGMVFFGMNVMSDATKPLRTYQPFIDVMQSMSNPFIGIFIGALFTGVVQSSSATMGIVIVLASQGFITLEAGIALAFGANIGTCITALLASIGKPREAVRAAVLHVIFKFVGVFIWLPFIALLAMVVREISPTAPPDLEGVARLAVETPRQIANAHTIFNVANAFIFIWFTGPLAQFMEWLIPEKQEDDKSARKSVYLEEVLLATPDLALDRARLEINWLGGHTLRMVRVSLPTVFNGDEDDLQALEKMDDDVDKLHGDILIYLGKLSQENLLKIQADQLYDYIAIANYIENIADIIQNNLVNIGRDRLTRNLVVSDVTQEILIDLHDEVCAMVELSLKSLEQGNQELAREVMAEKKIINKLANKVSNHLAQRLVADEPNRLATFQLESELIEYLKRMYYFAKRIARLVADNDQRHALIEPEPEPMVIDNDNVT
ncbi:Na/Pi cotransporter family protein [Anaerolineales bacterium HSG6]|nr:Na/Pi cotransporter family protein [Anaerolineales bacterium HSG6]